MHLSTGNPESNSHIDGQLIYDTRAKSVKWRKEKSLHRQRWENGILTCQRMKLDHPLTQCKEKFTQNGLDLNGKSKSIKYIDENTENAPHDAGCSDVPWV